MLDKRELRDEGSINFEDVIGGLDGTQVPAEIEARRAVKEQDENFMAGASGAGMIKDQHYFNQMRRLGKQTQISIRAKSTANYIASIQAFIDFLNLKDRAECKLGLKGKSTTDCLQLIAPKVEQIDEGKCTITLSKTGDILSSNFCVSLIYLSTERIYIYKYQGSSINELCTENVYEFLYSDITGINIENKIISIISEGKAAPDASDEAKAKKKFAKVIGLSNVSFIELYHRAGSIKLPIQPDSDIRDGKFALLRRVIRDKRNF